MKIGTLAVSILCLGASAFGQSSPPPNSIVLPSGEVRQCTPPQVANCEEPKPAPARRPPTRANAEAKAEAKAEKEPTVVNVTIQDQRPQPSNENTDKFLALILAKLTQEKPAGDEGRTAVPVDSELLETLKRNTENQEVMIKLQKDANGSAHWTNFWLGTQTFIQGANLGVNIGSFKRLGKIEENTKATADNTGKIAEQATAAATALGIVNGKMDMLGGVINRLQPQSIINNITQTQTGASASSTSSSAGSTSSSTTSSVSNSSTTANLSATSSPTVNSTSPAGTSQPQVVVNSYGGQATNGPVTVTANGGQATGGQASASNGPVNANGGQAYSTSNGGQANASTGPVTSSSDANASSKNANSNMNSNQNDNNLDSGTKPSQGGGDHGGGYDDHGNK